MTDTTCRTVLDAQDARNIRKADAICFDYDDGYGNPRIRAIIRGNDREGERTLAVPVLDQRVQDYTGATGAVQAFAMTMHAQHDAIARTLVRHIRAGSTISFRWTRGNDSPVTKDAGLVVDHLDVQVTNGKVTDTFRVETYIGLDNSARMVKRAHR